MILLDTHVLVWWINQDDQLTIKAKAAIQKEAQGEGKIFVSAITFWEIALLVKDRRIALDRDVIKWIDKLQELEYLEVVDIDTKIAVASVFLPESFHKDPADRIIVATARELGVPLVTADKKIREYNHVKTIW